MRKQIKVSIVVSALVVMCLVLAACPNSVKNATDAVNKYAITLSAFQDAEIKLHDAGKVSAENHHAILQAEIVAAKTGHELDAAIGIAASGGDPSQYIDVATKAFDDVLAAVNANEVSKQELALVVQTAGDALKNAISLIQVIHSAPTKPSAAIPTRAEHGSFPVWAFCLLPLMGLAAGGALGGVQLNQVIALLQIAMQLEPVAFDLIVKLADSLKGKSAQDVLAMNETLFSKVEQTAQSELNKS